MHARLMLHSQALGGPAPAPPPPNAASEEVGGTSDEPSPQSAKWEKSPQVRVQNSSGRENEVRGVMNIFVVCIKEKTKENSEHGQQPLSLSPTGSIPDGFSSAL